MADAAVAMQGIKCPATKEVMFTMPGIRVGIDEPVEMAIKRFRKQVERAGVVTECRRREAYEKPSIAKKRKEVAARKRLMKRLRRVRMRENREY